MKVWLKTPGGFVRIPHEHLEHFEDGEVGYWYPHSVPMSGFFRQYREYFRFEHRIGLMRGRFVLTACSSSYIDYPFNWKIK